MKKRFLSVLLCLVLVVGLLPTAAFAAGSDTDKAIQLGTSGISGYDATSGYDYIYFGNWTATDTYTTSEPIKWRVLDTKTNTGSDGLFLLTDKLMGYINVPFDESFSSNAWQGSDAQTWCKSFYNSGFSEGETGAVLATTKNDAAFTSESLEFAASDNILNGDMVFFLSAEEVENAAYGFTDNNARITNNDKIITDPDHDYAHWWLRSPSTIVDHLGNNVFAGAVSNGGGVNAYAIGNKWCPRPAFNLNLNSVLFTSAAEGGKPASGMESGLTAVSEYTGTEWKLTLLDNSRTFNAATTAYDAASKTVTVAYSGATPKSATAPNEYISAIIKDNSGSITHYGRVAQPESANGTLQIDLSGIDMTGRTLSVFSEQYNGDKKTDYASQPIEVPADRVNGYVVTNRLTNGVTSDGLPFAKTTENYTATLTAGDGYLLPATITVTVGGTALTAGTGYTYDSASGKLTIPPSSITGDIAIEAAGVAFEYSIAAAPATLNFGSIQTGYTAPAAQLVTIENTGNQQVTLNQPTASNYTISELSNTTLPYGNTVSLTVQPKAGLAVGNYDETLTVSGSNGVSAQVQLLFTVNKAEQTAPAKPELDSRTKNSITLKAIPDNANGAKAQYRMNDGEWQDSPVFTGLSSGTEYSFTARYAETDSYAASPASEAATFSTNSSGGYNPPVYYTLTFETNGGDKLSPVSGSYNALIDLSKYTPTRSGYAFTGWYSDKGLTEKITSIRLNGSKTVYAGWQAEQNPNTGANPFTDVNTTDWFYNDVMFVYEKGLMLGTSKTTFSPYGTATRGMMATILWRMEGSPAPKGGNGFADVDAGKWYADAITWTAENGIFRGYDNNLFMPENPITREQLAAIFYRYADYKGYDTSVKGNLSKFKDADKISDYAETAMQWAVGSGLIKGRDNGTLDPQGTATRAEIAAMLHRFIEKYDLVQGTTSGGMTGWISRNRLQIPQTGDSSALGLWGFTLCASLAAFLALGTRQLRRREEEAALQIIEK